MQRNSPDGRHGEEGSSPAHLDVACQLCRYMWEIPGPLRPGELFVEGDRVEKTSGYRYPGVVVSRFAKLNGSVRFVVECTAPGADGMLHIFSEKDLRHSGPNAWDQMEWIMREADSQFVSRTTSPPGNAMGTIGKPERYRPITERIDFWAATEAGGIRLEDEEDPTPIAQAHFAEYILLHGDARRYL